MKEGTLLCSLAFSHGLRIYQVCEVQHPEGNRRQFGIYDRTGWQPGDDAPVITEGPLLGQRLFAAKAQQMLAEAIRVPYEDLFIEPSLSRFPEVPAMVCETLSHAMAMAIDRRTCAWIRDWRDNPEVPEFVIGSHHLVNARWENSHKLHADYRFELGGGK